MSTGVAELEALIGETTLAEDVVAPGQVLRLAAALDREPPAVAPGDPVPAGWYQMFFPRLQPNSDLGADGQAQEMNAGPGARLPRRMFAGEQYRVHRPFRVGEAVRRRVTLAGVEAKRGRSGELVFAGYDVVIEGEGSVVLEGRWDIVYREAAKPGATSAAPAGPAAPERAAWERRVTPDAVMLFRYAAATFNAHRIHYDQPYATGSEGYPGLVVQGPLTATLLYNLAMDAMPERAIAGFRQRARAPLFADQHIRLLGEPAADGRSCDLWAATPAGHVAMEARAEFA